MRHSVGVSVGFLVGLWVAVVAVTVVVRRKPRAKRPGAVGVLVSMGAGGSRVDCVRLGLHIVRD